MLTSQFYIIGYHRILRVLSRLSLVFCFSLLSSALFAVFFSFSVNADIIPEDLDESNRNVRAVSSITITQQPESFTGSVGNTFTFSCEAQFNLDKPYSYTWFYKPLPNNSWRVYDYGSTISGVISSSVPVGSQFRCTVSYNDYSEHVNSNIVYILQAETLSFASAINWLGNNVFSPILSFVTPWGIRFGALIVGIFGAPLLVKAYKKFF